MNVLIVEDWESARRLIGSILHPGRAGDPLNVASLDEARAAGERLRRPRVGRRAPRAHRLRGSLEGQLAAQLLLDWAVPFQDVDPGAITGQMRRSVIFQGREWITAWCGRDPDLQATWRLIPAECIARDL